MRQRICVPALHLVLKTSLTIVLLLMAACPSLAQKRGQIAWPEIKIRDAIEQWPDEVTRGAPFSLADYYEIDPADNRAQLYLQTFLEYGNHTQPIEKIYMGNEGASIDRSVLKNIRKLRPYKERIGELYRQMRRNNQVGFSDKDRKRLLKMSAAFDPAFEKLRLAQQTKKQCFIPDKRFGSGISDEFFNYLLRVRFALEPNELQRIDELETILILKNDCSRLEEYGGGGSACFDQVIKPMLESREQSLEHLEKLIEVLKKYRQIQIDSDPVIEAERKRYLVRRQTLLGLLRKDYRNGPSARSRHYNEADQIFQRLHHIGPHFSPKNEDFNVNRWRAAGVAESEIAELERLSKQVKNADGQDGYPAQQQFFAFVGSKISQMTTSDFQRDMNILQERHMFIENACRLPFPESTVELTKIAYDWLPNDSWKSSPILVWCRPHSFDSRANSVLNTNVYLGLAIAKKWYLENDGKWPDDVEDVLNTASGVRPFLDPFSGKELRFKFNKSLIKVYSTGYNGKDDGEVSIGKSERRRIDEFPHLIDGVTPRKLPDGNIIFNFKVH